MSKYVASFLRRSTTSEFQKVFNSIIYDKSLDWGTRVFALACLSKPVDSNIRLVTLKNRLGTNFVSVNRWKKLFLESSVNKKWHILGPDLPVSKV